MSEWAAPPETALVATLDAAPSETLHLLVLFAIERCWNRSVGVPFPSTPYLCPDHIKSVANCFPESVAAPHVDHRCKNAVLSLSPMILGDTQPDHAQFLGFPRLAIPGCSSSTDLLRSLSEEPKRVEARGEGSLLPDSRLGW